MDGSWLYDDICVCKSHIDWPLISESVVNTWKKVPCHSDVLDGNTMAFWYMGQ